MSDQRAIFYGMPAATGGVKRLLRGKASGFAGKLLMGFNRRAVVIGTNEAAARLVNKLRSRNALTASVEAVFDDRIGRSPKELNGVKVVGTVDDLIGYARENPLDVVIIALPSSAKNRINSVLFRLRALPVDIVIIPDDVELGIDEGQCMFLAGERLPLLALRPIAGLGGWLKRAMDILISLLGLIVLAPLLALISLFIALDSPGPILFKQRRVGFNNRPFVILKFRSMVAEGPDQTGELGTQRNDPRITRVGKILRRFSADELPQLVNVLKGDMSIVGPRPQVIDMRIGDHRYAEAVATYIERHKVKPGLTGWAQVNGSRGGIGTLEKAAWAVSMDLYYIQNWSIRFDIEVMVRTIGMIISGRDAV